uniref:Uncharacterized protein n=1 Tax=Arundo donax TaxID=35708 RepID=A0A0A8ZHB2_ARUDO
MYITLVPWDQKLLHMHKGKKDLEFYSVCLQHA